jgi:serine/threonine protein kinase
MGVVYRARQRSLDRVVALKVIRDEVAESVEYRQRFVREAHLAASVDHPHIVSVFEVGELDGRLLLALQWVSGQDLRAILSTTRSGLEPERAVRLLSQVSGALDAMHSVAGLVHRDVKPSNVLVRDVGGTDHAYLTDFGIAKRSDSVADLTATGAVVGTVDYMAPEQIRGARTDARTDVYALGCVFYEMLSGRVPFERENSVAKLFAHVSDPPPRLPATVARRYPSFGPVLAQAMAKDPAERYMSAGDFAKDATAALQGMRFMGPPSIVATGDARPAVTTEAPTAGVQSPPAPSAPVTEPSAQAQAPTRIGEPPPLQAQPLPTPLPPPASSQGYGYLSPPPPAQSRGVNALALVLLAVVALAGIGVGALAAAGVFSRRSSTTAITATNASNGGAGRSHHRAGQSSVPSVAPPTTTSATTAPGRGLQALPVQCGYGVAGSPQGMTCRFANNAFYEYWHASAGNPTVSESINVWSREGHAYYPLACSPGGGVIDCTGQNGSGVALDARFTQHALSIYTPAEAAAYARSGKLGPHG